MQLIKFLLFVCSLTLYTNISAQEKVSIFQPISQVAMVNGSRGLSASLGAVAGLRLKPLYVGLGTGIDYYRLRSIPVFIALRKDLGKGPAFLYTDAGYHFDWLTDKNKNESPFGTTNPDYSGGLYYDIGIGARLNKKAKDGFTLGAGYSMKRMKQQVQSYICPFVGTCTTYNEEIRYNLGRIMIKAGWLF